MLETSRLASSIGCHFHHDPRFQFQCDCLLVAGWSYTSPTGEMRHRHFPPEADTAGGAQGAIIVGPIATPQP
jgi:hypothetical protein